MVQNVRRGFNLHGYKKVFFINMVIMYWTLNIKYMQFEYQYPKSSNVSVEHVQLLRGIFGFFEPKSSNVSVDHVQLLRGMFGFFEPREMLRSFAARGMYCLKLV